MPPADPTRIRELCATLQVDEEFFVQCLEASVVEVHEVDGRLELANATVLRLRRLERICATLEVPLPAALMLSHLTQRVADLEDELNRLRARLG